jgi:hypothetical protein
MPIGVGETLSRGYVEGPEMPGATDDLALDGPLADWSPPMRAFVIDGIYCVLHLKERDESAPGLYHLAVAAGNFFQRSNLDPFLCHTILLEEQPRVMTLSPLAEPRFCHRVRPPTTSGEPQGCRAVTVSHEDVVMIFLQGVDRQWTIEQGLDAMGRRKGPGDGRAIGDIIHQSRTSDIV